MATFRIHKTGDYTVMSNRHFREKGMSLKAKGLLSLMLSLPEDWDYSAEGLATLSKDGRDGVKSGLRELERFGYLVRSKRTDEAGRFTGYDYDIFENPEDAPFGHGETRRPSAPKPSAEKPSTGKPPQYITKGQNTYSSNTYDRKDKLDTTDKDSSYEEYNGSRREDDSLVLGRDKDFEKETAQRKAEAEADFEFLAHGNGERLLLERHFRPSSLTKQLIKAKYIDKDDLFIENYNAFLCRCVEGWGFKQVRSCLTYFISRIKGNVDVSAIGDKYSYFEQSIVSGLERTSDEYRETLAKRLGVPEFALEGNR